ncbi:positive regulation of ruffle assembly [Mactra antiquata]
MFRKKGASEVEIARENEIKISLTQELSAALKAIQREKVDCEEQDVYSTDTANTICNCIEAIFLHGLKSKAVTKLANYVGLKNQASSQPSLNFWNFVSRFTHGEVISQLKHLGQINSEIGFCRAWVRVALNDGILESYVDAMVADKKTLGYFYNNFAYLRDSEQPGIMLTYLQGLMSFEFKLSYNASVLNNWTYAPLRLAGIIDTQDAPPPVIKPAAKRPQDSAKSSKRKKDGNIDNNMTVEVTRSSSRSKGRKRGDNKDSTHNPMEQPSFGNPPDHSYYVTSSHFTTHDVEAFKKLGRGMPQSVSECSSSSHVSAPDPPHMNVSPAAYVDRFESMKGSPMSIDSGKVGRECHHEEQGYDSFDGARNDRVVKADLVNDVDSDDDIQRFDEKYSGDDEVETEKKTDLEESWEEFYKSPLKKGEDNLDKFRKIQRLDSVNRDVREEALLRSILNSESSNNVEDEVMITSRKTEGFDDLYREYTAEMKHDSDNVKTKISEADNDNVRKSDGVVYTNDDKEINSEMGKSSVNKAEEFTSDTSDLLNMSQKLLNEIGIKDDFVETTEGAVTDVDGSVVEVEHVKSTPKKSKGKALDNLKPQLSLSPPKSAEPELSDAVADTVVQIRTLENPDYLSKHRLSLPAVSPLAKERNSSPRKSLPNIIEGAGNVIKNVQSIYSSTDNRDETGRSTSKLYDGMSTSLYNTGSPSNVSGRGDNVSTRTEQEMARDISEKRQSGSNNLLCTGRGWSSSFDSEIDDSVDALSSPRSNSGLPISRPKTESFGSLLQNYTPASSLSARSVDDVISNLPHRTDTVLSPASSQKSEEGGNLEGFEVLMNDSTMQDSADASRLEMFSTISNEKGLDSQNFQCKGCSRALGLIFGKQRVCKYDGGYYCYECHENDVYYIPALIVHNWDFRKHHVCKKNLEFLQDKEEQPYLNIDVINPRLYDHVSDMQDIRTLRIQLMILKTYLFTCKQSIAEDFRKLLWPRDYLFESTELYSLADLLQVPNGALASSIRKVIKFATKHVYSCRLCSQKGFICELCHNAKVIYPFEIESTYRCSQCKSVFHKECKTDNRPCPKCLRRASRQSFQGNNEIVLTPDYDQHMEHES